MKLSFLFGAGAEISYGLPSGGIFFVKTHLKLKVILKKSELILIQQQRMLENGYRKITLIKAFLALVNLFSKQLLKILLIIIESV